jgi:hypothetical protein
MQTLVQASQQKNVNGGEKMNNRKLITGIRQDEEMKWTGGFAFEHRV